MLGLELVGLELDDDVTPKPQVVEEQVEIEVSPIDLEMHLPADKSEAGPEFQEELGDVRDERVLDLALVRLGPERQEVEAVRIFEALARKVGLRLG